MKKKIVIALIVSVSAMLFWGDTASSQDNIPVSQVVVERGKELDKQIVETSRRIANLVVNTDLLNSDIRILPYQASYRTSGNMIEMENHSFIRDDIYNNRIIGINKRIVRIFVEGKNISKIETIMYENNHVNGNTTVVKILDPSPLAETTDEITFTHIINARAEQDKEGNVSYAGKTLLEGRRLGDIRNNDSSPLQNQVKSDFILPNLVNIYNNVLFITQAYQNSRGDSDGYMAEFLKEALKK